MSTKSIIQRKLLFPEILTPWPKTIHKHARGKILVCAGSRGMTGAAALVCESAYRSGAGVVCLAFPESLSEIYEKILREVITLPCPETSKQTLSLAALPVILKKSQEFDIIVIGPGLSQNFETCELVRKLIIKLEKSQVLDADGLNALVGYVEILKKRKYPQIFTPHPGEMARLCGINVNVLQKNREKIAKAKAREWQAIVVLKGADTVIADFKGKVVINKTGGPALATAGTGDVLCGLISTFWAQNLEKAFEAACTAVYLHGLAADLAQKDLGVRSIIASDVIKYLPQAIKKESLSLG